MLRAAARYLAPASATTRLVSTASKVSRRGRKLLLNKALGSRYSRRQADRVIRKGVVSICGRVAKAHYMVRPGDVVKVNGEVVEWEFATLQKLHQKTIQQPRFTFQIATNGVILLFIQFWIGKIILLLQLELFWEVVSSYL